MKYDVITIGGAVRDFIFYLDKEYTSAYICIPVGGKVNIKEAYFTSGGGACNVAVGLANFGLKTAAVVRLGDDWLGQGIISRFKEKKVDTKFVQIDKTNRTGVSSVIHPYRGERAILTYRGANENLETGKLNVKIKTKWIYLSSLYKKRKEILAKVFAFKKKNRNLKIAWNPGVNELQDRTIRKFIKDTDLLIINKNEARILADGAKDIFLMIKRILAMKPKILVITAGKDGVYVADDSDTLYEKTRAKKIINTIGAGDSFSSGFLAGLIIYKNIKKATKLGLYNSAANLKVFGAQDGLLTKKDLRKIEI